MPGAAMLPFMMIELCGYGLSAGLLRNAKIPTFRKVIILQISGRAIRTIAILAAVYLLGNESVRIASIWTSITAGLFGIVLQWAFLPLIVYHVRDMRR